MNWLPWLIATASGLALGTGFTQLILIPLLNKTRWYPALKAKLNRPHKAEVLDLQEMRRKLTSTQYEALERSIIALIDSNGYRHEWATKPTQEVALLTCGHKVMITSHRIARIFCDTCFIQSANAANHQTPESPEESANTK